MKPKIEFRLNRKTTSLDVRIKIYGIPAGLYSTGIPVTESNFDQEKQICGDVSVQVYMNMTRSALERAYRPGMSAQEMWAEFINKATKDNSRPLVVDAFSYYLETMNLADNTRRNIENTKSKVEIAGMLNMPLENITPMVVRQFINQLTGEDSTRYLGYVQLKTVLLRYIKDHSLSLQLNIDGLMPRPRTTEGDEREDDYLSYKEVQTLLRATMEGVQAEVRDAFMLMCFTGMAISDILRFDPKDCLSADEKWIFYKRRKTKRGKRCRVPLFPITRKLVFKREWPIKLSKRTIQVRCSEFGEIIGKRVTSHTGRHTFGAMMLYFGFSMESVREMMGHSSIRVTEQIYAKVGKEKIEKELAGIPKQMDELVEGMI